MGVDHYIYVIAAAKYIKLVRPHLIKNYGPINVQYLIHEQARRKKHSDFLQSINNGDLSSMFMPTLPSQKQRKLLPIQRFMQTKSANRFKRNRKESVDVNQILQKESVHMYDERNYFLRLDQFLGTVDCFDDGIYKVCNHLNIQNFLTYIEVVKAVRQQEVERLKQVGTIYPKPTKEKKEKSQTNTEEVQQLEPYDDYDYDCKALKKNQELKQFLIFDQQYRGVYYAEKMFQQAYKVMKKYKKEMYVVFRSS